MRTAKCMYKGIFYGWGVEQFKGVFILMGIVIIFSICILKLYKEIKKKKITLLIVRIHIIYILCFSCSMR